MHSPALLFASRYGYWVWAFAGCCFLSLFCVLVLLGGVSEDCRFSSPHTQNAVIVIYAWWLFALNSGAPLPELSRRLETNKKSHLV